MSYKFLKREDALRNADVRVNVERTYEGIDKEAFRNNIKIRNVEMPGIREIECSAFEGCTALRTVHMPVVEAIRKNAFAGCSNLGQISLPAVLTTLEKNCFSKCKRLARVWFEDHAAIYKLASGIFAECRKMTELHLPSGLEIIGEETFYKCDSLTRVKLPDGLKRIERRGFYQCGFQNLILPEGLEYIGESAFLKCRNLEYIKIPESVQVIEKWAFHGCSRLKILEIRHDPGIVGEWITNKDCTIRCPAGSRMETYALELGTRVETF